MKPPWIDMCYRARLHGHIHISQNFVVDNDGDFKYSIWLADMEISDKAWHKHNTWYTKGSVESV